MTKEERALEKYPVYMSEYSNGSEWDTNEESRLAYTEGLYDQETITLKEVIDKACDWLKSYRQDTPECYGYIAGIVNDKTIEDFRKAMENNNIIRPEYD